jgi:hypothetical protein
MEHLWLLFATRTSDSLENLANSPSVCPDRKTHFRMLLAKREMQDAWFLAVTMVKGGHHEEAGDTLPRP